MISTLKNSVSIKDIPAVLLDAHTFVHGVGIDDDVVLGRGGEDAHTGKVSLLQLRSANTRNRGRAGKYRGLPLGSALPPTDEGTTNFKRNELDLLGRLIKIKHKVVRRRGLCLLLGLDCAVVIICLLRIAVHGRDPLLPQWRGLGG